MGKTLEELEKDLAELYERFTSEKRVNPSDISDLRDELTKIQSALQKSSIPAADEKRLKKKVRRLKEKPWYDLFSEPEYEEIEVDGEA